MAEVMEEEREYVRPALKQRACEQLRHRNDTPCAASADNLLEQALERLAVAESQLERVRGLAQEWISHDRRFTPRFPTTGSSRAKELADAMGIKP